MEVRRFLTQSGLHCEKTSLCCYSCYTVASVAQKSSLSRVLSCCCVFQHSLLALLPAETLAMKGLTLNCMERKEEAYEIVRKGLKV